MSAAAHTEGLAPDLPVEKFLHPDLLIEGELPERRISSGGISWSRYLTIDGVLGNERINPRLYYLEGQLEIVTTSNIHEHIKGLLELLVEEHLFRDKIPHIRRGMATLRLAEIVGAEPDASWCILAEKEFPDLVVEVALSSGGIQKLDIYRLLGVPEVWIWRKGALSFYRLDPGATGYERHETSLLIPRFDLALLARCVPMRDWMEIRRTVRNALGN